MNESKKPSPELALTVDLLRRAKCGESAALDELISRFVPRLTRWATGRLPMRARALLDTADLVQDALVGTLQTLDRIEVRGPTSFQAYVRQAVLNRVRDQVRWADLRRGSENAEDLEFVDPSPSPLEQAIGADVVRRYERSLATLSEEERQVIHLHVELDYDYGAIAEMTGRPSRDAARMAVQRALKRLAEAMGHEETT